jgi:uncharacterized protein (DUF983 family)
MTELRRVLRRCPHCRLLFEGVENVDDCVVCGAAIDGLALAVTSDVAAPTVEVDREPTLPLAIRPN